MQNAHRQIVREQMVKDMERCAENYKAAGDLPHLCMQQKSMLKLILSRTSGLQQPSPRHQH